MNAVTKEFEEISLRVMKHLTQQNGQAMLVNHTDMPYESCAYRAADGKMCAVGCLITDEFYSPELERCGLDEEVVRLAVAKSLGLRSMNYVLYNILCQWQDYHDCEVYRGWCGQLEGPDSPAEFHAKLMGRV